MFASFLIMGTVKSLLAWERGLKYSSSAHFRTFYSSLLAWERGLKSGIITKIDYRANSRSLRGSVD